MSPEQFQSIVIHWQGSWFLLGFAICWIFLTLANQKWVDRVTRNDYAGVYALIVIAVVIFTLLIMPYIESWAMLAGILAFVVLVLLIVLWHGKIKSKINLPKKVANQKGAK